jgi:Tol biopolymer transport system component
MTQHDRLERNLPDLMAELASARVPEYFEDLLRATARTRQRPAWSSLERWLPMDLALSPGRTRVRWLALFAAVALVALALIAGVLLFAGSRAPALPAPFGPARNGLLYYPSANGDVTTLDLASMTSTKLKIATQASFGAPLSSRDGRSIAFTAPAAGGQISVDVADADGANLRTLAGTYADLKEIDWSPTSDRLAIITTVGGAGKLVVVPTDGSAATTLALSVEPSFIWWLPDGRLVFAGKGGDAASPTYAIYTANADGSGLQAVLAPTANESGFLGLSPSVDGHSVVYYLWRDPDQTGRIHIVDLLSGLDREVPVTGIQTKDHYESTLFSPDGTQILATFFQADSQFSQLSVVPASGGVPHTMGPKVPYQTSPLAYFAPDGKTVLAYYPSLGEVWQLDPTGGQNGGDRKLPITPSDLPIWQRVAP